MVLQMACLEVNTPLKRDKEIVVHLTKLERYFEDITIKCVRALQTVFTAEDFGTPEVMEAFSRLCKCKCGSTIVEFGDKCGYPQLSAIFRAACASNGDTVCFFVIMELGFLHNVD